MALTNPDQAANRWDESEWRTGVPVDYWSYHPLIDAYINATIIPHKRNMLEWLVDTYLDNVPCQRAISVCCGMGGGDHQALAAGVCHYIEGFDISPQSIAAAEELAKVGDYVDKVSYAMGDMNSIVLEQNRYDIGLAFGAFHHIENLEHACQQLQRALKPGSLLLVNEYIGPARMQWTEQQLNMFNRVLDIFPRQWRRTDKITPYSIEAMLKIDPSEAVRSDEVIATLSDYFEVVDYCDYGGGLLMPLWSMGLLPQIFVNDPNVDKQVIIKLLILIDELLAEHQIAPSNYAQLVLRNHPPSAKQIVAPRRSIDSTDRKSWVNAWLPNTQFVPPPTPWWLLPARAWRVLSQRGFYALRSEMVEYWRWSRS
ncbi:MAG: class I SAM-dependent methyltransferase [Caldilineaceae bacterium]|nr:class I SAM-dependent methyltransferase [Caldilineaceae bacterium]